MAQLTFRQAIGRFSLEQMPSIWKGRLKEKDLE